MPKGKDLTTTELNEIKNLLKEGLNYDEVAELTGRTKKSVTNAVYRYNLKDKRPRIESMKDSVVPKTIIEDHEPRMEKTLKDFSPRDIIKYMYGLGYRIENNELVCLVKQKVNVKDIING